MLGSPIKVRRLPELRFGAMVGVVADPLGNTESHDNYWLGVCRVGQAGSDWAKLIRPARIAVRQQPSNGANCGPCADR